MNKQKKQAILKMLSEKTRIPAIAAPMFLVSSPELVISCCESGMIGSFPAPNARTTDILQEWLDKITKKLSMTENVSAPWALNMVTHSSYKRFNEELDLVKKYKPPIVITALGSPAPVVDAVHEYGGIVLADVNSLYFAKKAAETGIDGLVLVSSGAGGHTGTMNGFSFTEAVRKFWDGLIVLAGGISTGYGILGAQAAGADLAYMGTSFIATEESMAQPEYKEMVVDARFEDILMTNSFTGVHANMLKPSIIRAGLNPDELKPKDQIDFDDPQGNTKAWRDIWSAGHGVASVNKLQKASDVVGKLVQEYSNAKESLEHHNMWTLKEEVK